MQKVALIKCFSYSEKEVLDSLEAGIDLLGGIEALFIPEEKILLKPNILIGDEPGKSVTTHPVVVGGVCDIFLNRGFPVTFGDSPGFGSPKRAAERSGIYDMCKEKGIELADFESISYVPHPDGTILKKIPLAKGITRSDAVVSISKMKTHGLTRITGAVKNQFGCLPGLIKGEFHVKMPDILDFSKVLHDINSLIRPRLYIMDGITAMDGNGPRGGDSVNMNVLLFSTDPVALDMVFCKLIDLNPLFVPTLRSSSGDGLIMDFDDIEITGDKPDDIVNPDFNVVRKPFDRFASSRNFPAFLKNLISPKPVIDYNTCKNCGRCVLQCPTVPKSLNWIEKGDFAYPVFNYKSCIRCYCCQEICPYRSISIKTPVLGKLIRR